MCVFNWRYALLISPDFCPKLRNSWEDGFWRNFTMVAWVISRKPKNVWFPAVKKFWDVVWHSNYHRSKAEVKWNKKMVKYYKKKTNFSSQKPEHRRYMFWKKVFLRSILGSEFSPFFRRLIFNKNHVFKISEKMVGDNPLNVYIFWTTHARAFQNCFDHVHPTPMDDSTSPQLGDTI